MLVRIRISRRMLPAAMSLAVAAWGMLPAAGNAASSPRWARPVPVIPTSDVEGPQGLVCQSRTLCVANGPDDTVITSTDPTGGRGAWHVSTLDGVGSQFPADGLHFVACASSRLCVGAEEPGPGRVFSSDDPAAGASSWRSDGISPPLAHTRASQFGAACAPRGLCVITDSAGDVLTSTTPGRPGAPWASAHVDSIRVRCSDNASSPSTLADISCLTATFCAAPDQNQGYAFPGRPPVELFTSSNPTEGADASRTSELPGVRVFSSSISCASARLCMVAEQPGISFTGCVSTSSTTPVRPRSARSRAKTCVASPPHCSAKALRRSRGRTRWGRCTR